MQQLASAFSNHFHATDFPNKKMAAKFIFFLILLSHLSPSSSHSNSINVWPKPRIFSWPKPQASFLPPEFTITITTPDHHHHLSSAVSRYLALIKSEYHSPIVPPSVNTSFNPLRTLSIEVDDLSAPLTHGVNESYSLTITAEDEHIAYLSAPTAWGAMRGLETFSQLVWGKPLRVAVGVYVWDDPIFAHRGLLLDTSRNYYGVDDILRTIVAMSWNKMNVFHWHITDSQSFPLVLPSEPDLAAKGSYGDDMQYSVDDVQKIVEFGLDYGVRVIPEIDTPGHTGSWAAAHPEIVTCANKFWWPAGTEWADRLASEPGTGQLNPLNPKTFQVMINVIQDVANIFQDQFFHAGGDEIIPGCWKSDPTIQSFLSSGGTLSQVLEKFVNFIFPYIVALNRTVIFWEDVLLDENISIESSSLYPEYTILQSWNNGTGNVKKIVEAGYRVIVSSAAYYYLDCGHGGFLGNDSQYDRYDQPADGGSWCAPFKTWQTIYNYDITEGLSEEEAELVLGGEVALWSEQSDPTVLDARLWPRTAAMAEALWSGNRDETGKKRYAEATDRLNEWRHRMVKRGIGAEPIQPLWCVKNPGMCNTVHPYVAPEEEEGAAGNKKIYETSGGFADISPRHADS